MFLVGSTGLPSALVRSLEEPYAGVDFRTVPPADAVVMLGGGIEPARLEAPGFHLNRAGDRVLMALELIRLGKAPVLVLGGGTGTIAGETRVEADLLKAWIEQDATRARRGGDQPRRVREYARARRSACARWRSGGAGSKCCWSPPRAICVARRRLSPPPACRSARCRAIS